MGDKNSLYIYEMRFEVGSSWDERTDTAVNIGTIKVKCYIWNGGSSIWVDREYLFTFTT